MYRYFKTELINGVQIVVSELFKKDKDEILIEVPKEYSNINIIGTRWNGTTFEEVPMEEVEAPETTEVTNADLLEVLLAIGEKVGA